MQMEKDDPDMYKAWMWKQKYGDQGINDDVNDPLSPLYEGNGE